MACVLAEAFVTYMYLPVVLPQTAVTLPPTPGNVTFSMHTAALEALNGVVLLR